MLEEVDIQVTHTLKVEDISQILYKILILDGWHEDAKWKSQVSHWTADVNLTIFAMEDYLRAWGYASEEPLYDKELEKALNKVSEEVFEELHV